MSSQVFRGFPAQSVRDCVPEVTTGDGCEKLEIPFKTGVLMCMIIICVAFPRLEQLCESRVSKMRPW